MPRISSSTLRVALEGRIAGEGALFLALALALVLALGPGALPGSAQEPVATGTGTPPPKTAIAGEVAPTGGSTTASPSVAIGASSEIAGERAPDEQVGTPPSPADVLGYELGERFTEVAEVYRYLETLAGGSERVRTFEYGRTPEGRTLMQVVIAAPRHQDRLEEILARNRELTDPETPEERAREIIADNPAVAYLSYGVHGDESSSSEAALWTTWDLARGAPEVEGVLDSLVVVVDPALNPDGRDRYVTWYRQARGEEPNPEPAAREHRPPWPGGRYNHYLFDLNRDWAWMSQPETRARLATWDRWNPQVHVDFHEMSRTSTYFFFPPTPPINPIYPEHVLDWGERFGRANADAFDRRGWLYFTSSTYDLFYPGYGDSWPSLLGSVGMTYEQAGGGSAGLVVERPDGTRLTLEDRAEHHRTAGRTTLRTAAEGRTELLEGFARSAREVDVGLSDVLLVAGERSGAADALVTLLLGQGIRVERAAEEFETDAEAHPGYEARERFPAGTYRVRARQPRGRLAAALLRPDNPLEADFSYDITAWSLPYAYGVEAHTPSGDPDAEWRPVEEPPGTIEAPVAEVVGTPSAGVVGPPSAGDVGAPAVGGVAAPASASVGYLLRPGFDAAPALVDFLEAGGRAVALGDPFVHSGASYPRGTYFLARSRNPDLEEKLEASGLAGQASPVATGRTTSGPDLGTADGLAVQLPRIALLGGRGTRPTSFGAHWYFLEQKLGVPFDALNVEDVAEVGLDPYDVAVVPAGSGLRGMLGGPGMEELERFVRAGGVLVAVDSGARTLAGPLASVEVRNGPNGDADDPEAGSEEERLNEALAPRREREEERWRESLPGAILPVELDPDHPLAYGAAGAGFEARAFVLSAGHVFEPSPAFESAVFFPEGVEQVSGEASSANLERLARGSWLVDRSLGAGSVVLFADDPLFRLFWYAGFQPYVNALLLGPAD